MTDIEIGISLTTRIYLKVLEEVEPVPFECNIITNIKEVDGVTIVECVEPVSLTSSRSVINEYKVLNPYEEVKEAYETAMEYKRKGIEAIEKVL